MQHPSTAALAFTTNLPARGAFAAPRLDAARITEDPFTLGVASGDPHPHSVILWTRLTPTAAATPGSRHGPRSTRGWGGSFSRFPSWPTQRSVAKQKPNESATH